MNITAATKLVGLLGYPVSHSLSPRMHNAAFSELGLDYAYLPLPVAPAELAKGIAGLKALGFWGFNVTIPHKETIIPLLDWVDEEAGRIGAVNTVVNRQGRLYGYNTDAGGFLRSAVQELAVEAEGLSAVILGAGGSARAIAFALANAGAAKLTIANRRRESAAKLCAELSAYFPCGFESCELAGEKLDQALKNSTLVVQTSPVGMYPATEAKPVINPERLYCHNLVYDIIFNPRETLFLQGARSQGCRTANGLGMLLHQGALAFEHWTGQAAPLGVMKQALTDKL